MVVDEIASDVTGRQGVTAGEQQQVAVLFSSIVLRVAPIVAVVPSLLPPAAVPKCESLPVALQPSPDWVVQKYLTPMMEMAMDEGIFVWTVDRDGDFVSTRPRQFLIRIQGDGAIDTIAPTSGAALNVAGMVNAVYGTFARLAGR